MVPNALHSRRVFLAIRSEILSTDAIKSLFGIAKNSFCWFLCFAKNAKELLIHGLVEILILKDGLTISNRRLEA